MTEAAKRETLTAKQEKFKEEYLICFNATEAARRAGYGGNSVTLAAIGWENLRKPLIAQAIRQRLEESAMSADEVLMRLADQARGNIGDFVQIIKGAPVFDFSGASEQGKMHLVKKLKTKTKTYMPKGASEDDEPIIEIDVEFELYDSQSALVHIGKHHGLFVDKTEVTGKGGAPLLDSEFIDALRKMYGDRSGAL